MQTSYFGLRHAQNVQSNSIIHFELSLIAVFAHGFDRLDSDRDIFNPVRRVIDNRNASQQDARFEFR